MKQSPFPMPPLTPVVKALLIACVALFVLQLALGLAGINLVPVLGFVPARLLDGWLWQLVSYSLLHSGMLHLLFNTLILWSIGSELESSWGSKLFAIYFGCCVLGAALAYGLMTAVGIGSAQVPVVGSSGGVYGLLVAYGILFGDRVLYFFMLFPIQARYFVMILGAMELISSVFYSEQGVAHVAHLGGMFTGFVFLAALAQWRIRVKDAARSKLLGAEEREKRVKGAKHLRLVDDEETPKHWH
jgi:membrane associated rhomboid family serine protease